MCLSGKSQTLPRGIPVTISGLHLPCVGTERLWNVVTYRNQEKMSWESMEKLTSQKSGMVMVYVN